MFYHFFFTIAALILVTSHMPPPEAPFSAVSGWLYILMASMTFILAIRQWNKFFLQRSHQISPSGIAEICHTRLQVQNLILLLFFGFLVHVFHLPIFVSPGAAAQYFPFLGDLFSLFFYFLLLSCLWYLTADTFLPADSAKAESRKNFIREQTGLTLPALLPWLILSGLHDLIMLMPFSEFRNFFTSTTGQAIYFFIIFTGVFIFAPLCIQKFWGCYPLPQGPERHRIEAMLTHTRTGFRDILVWPLFGGRMLTAGIMGPLARFRYILVTPALLRTLYPEELEAVIAHEAGHARHRHLFLYLLILAGFLLVSWLFLDFLYQLLLLSGGSAMLSRFSFLTPSAVASFLAVSLSLLLFFVYFRFLFGFFMRNFERQADSFAFKTQGTARHLIQTFRTLGQMTGQNPDKPNWHHFSLTQRIHFLQACEENPHTAQQHDNKVRLALIFYSACLLLTGAAGWHMHTKDWGGKLPSQLIIRNLETKIARGQENPLLLRYLGDLYQETKRYEKALASYRRALDAGSRDPDLLNNLAWLYITAEGTAIADPVTGTALAEQAAHIQPESPHILDTLAEGYYRTGQVGRAIGLAEKALFLQRAEGGNTEYYRDQLEKFRQKERSQAAGQP
ncbi:M48 family metalloprotease [Desulfobotulus sp. H1]|uniref:M48 family metalloprotease n=1 Tax=Desulfobotulus pelophilus TaxID=2823377 RepID=A0ABT3N8D5_9BACT|nr:M48 family metallopeptidase [Desulfobotulus pelophilus]MCW7753717.1 M48 family metalloprotease [Desulfobotulus pelophilus]